MDKKTLKHLNSQLASSAQQEVRDKALDQLIRLMIKEKQWVTKPEKDLKVIWEGLFFLFWHSDKSSYQRDVALKISEILTQIAEIDKEHAQQWFEAFIYIFNLHWDKVDNYRIDKYLMFLRFQFNSVLRFIKDNQYLKDDLDWFTKIIKKLFVEESLTSKGIPLQISDIFLQELNKVDAEDISFVNLSTLLDPFLYSMAHCNNRMLIGRLQEKVFLPILENNVTVEVPSEPEDENAEPKWRDGGKLPLKTEKEIMKMINQSYQFPNFNILLFAQESIFKYASAPSTKEENRDALYSLYDKALKLEPEPEHKELTFSQRMMINKARTFITKKQQRRMKFTKQKRNQKLIMKLGKMIANKLHAQQVHQEQLEELHQLEEEKQQIIETGGTSQYLDFLKDSEEKETKKVISSMNGSQNGKNGTSNGHSQNGGKQQEDIVMTINAGQKGKKKNKDKKRPQVEQAGEGEKLQNGNKRVKFDLSHSQTREFFMYGKVATQTLPSSIEKPSPSKGLIKTTPKK